MKETECTICGVKILKTQVRENNYCSRQECKRAAQRGYELQYRLRTTETTIDASFREQVGLPSPQKKIVECLKCDRKFMSHDFPKYRICPGCRQTNRFMIDTYDEAALGITFNERGRQ